MGSVGGGAAVPAGRKPPFFTPPPKGAHENKGVIMCTCGI